MGVCAYFEVVVELRVEVEGADTFCVNDNKVLKQSMFFTFKMAFFPPKKIGVLLTYTFAKFKRNKNVFLRSKLMS